MKKIILILLLIMCIGCNKNTGKKCTASLSDASNVKVEVIFQSKDNIVYSLEKTSIVNISNYDQETIEKMKKQISSRDVNKIYGITSNWEFIENQVIRKDVIDLEKASLTSLIEQKIIPYYDQDEVVIYYDTLVELFKNQSYQVVQDSN